MRRLSFCASRRFLKKQLDLRAARRFLSITNKKGKWEEGVASVALREAG
jgi:hypothetical protein